MGGFTKPFEKESFYATKYGLCLWHHYSKQLIDD